MMRVWAIEWGQYYTDGVFSGEVFKTKALAARWLRERGYKFNKEQELFLNEAEQHYARIEKANFTNA